MPAEIAHKNELNGPEWQNSYLYNKWRIAGFSHWFFLGESGKFHVESEARDMKVT